MFTAQNIGDLVLITARSRRTMLPENVQYGPVFIDSRMVILPIAVPVDDRGGVVDCARFSIVDFPHHGGSFEVCDFIDRRLVEVENRIMTELAERK